MFNVVHKNVRGGSNDKYPVGDFQKKIPSNDFHENDFWFLWFKMVVFYVSRCGTVSIS